MASNITVGSKSTYHDQDVESVVCTPAVVMSLASVVIPVMMAYGCFVSLLNATSLADRAILGYFGATYALAGLRGLYLAQRFIRKPTEYDEDFNTSINQIWVSKLAPILIPVVGAVELYKFIKNKD